MLAVNKPIPQGRGLAPVLLAHALALEHNMVTQNFADAVC